MFLLLPVLVIGLLIAGVNTKPKPQSLRQASVASSPHDSTWRECQVIDSSLMGLEHESQVKELGCQSKK